MLSRLGIFTAGVVSATVALVVAGEVWLHLIEHNAYRNGAR